MTASANARLETFRDGVFAIARTLLIIDVRIPVTTAIATSVDLWLSLKPDPGLRLGVDRGSDEPPPHSIGTEGLLLRFGQRVRAARTAARTRP